MPVIMGCPTPSPPDTDSINHPLLDFPLSQPLLSLSCTFSSPALDSKLNSADNVSNMWTVLTKCKDVVKDGRRLENVCWRLWHQACVNRNTASSTASSSRSPIETRDYAFESDDGYSTISSGSSSASSTSGGSQEEGNRTAEEDWESASEPEDAGIKSVSVGPIVKASPKGKRASPQPKKEQSQSDEDEGFVTTDDEVEESPPPPPTHPPLTKKAPARPELGRSKSSNKEKGRITPATGVQRPPARQSASSSTPKASSYPTPSGSLVDAKPPHAGVTRTRSHLEDVTSRQKMDVSRAEITGTRKMRWDGKGWTRETAQMTAERERSFGQVLDLVFNKSEGNVDVQEMCRNVVTARRNSYSTGRSSGSPLSDTQDGEKAAIAPSVVVADCSVSPRNTSENWRSREGVSIGSIVDVHQPRYIDSKASSLTTESMSLGGPEVRVVGPTPVPSRVGSLGDTTAPTPPKTPLGSVMHAPLALPNISETTSNSGGSMSTGGSRLTGLTPMSSAMPGRARVPSGKSDKTQSSLSSKSTLGNSPVYSPQLEKDDPIDTAIQSQMANESINGSRRDRSASKEFGESSEQRLSASALRRLGEAQIGPVPSSHANSSSRKKGKKSMFFIHSPSDRHRHGSVSAVSDGSTDAGSTLADSSVGTSRVPASPGRPRSIGRPGTSPLACHASSTPNQPGEPAPITSAEIMVASPQPIADVAEMCTKVKPPAPAAGRRKSSGSSRLPPRRPSQETKPAIRTNPTHAQLQRLQAPPKRVASASNMAGKFAGEKAKAAAAIAARLEAQQQQEKEKQQEARNKILDMKRQKSEPDFLGAQARAAQRTHEEEDESFETVDEDEDIGSDENDEDGWSSASDSPGKAKKSGSQSGSALVITGKSKSSANKAASALQTQQAKAAEEAQRKRELFAKRAIFGNSGQSSLSLAKPEPVVSSSNVAFARPSLLSKAFETQRDGLQRGESMADLTQSAAPKQSTPVITAAPNIGAMHRSKSAAAIPAMSGVSIGRGGLMDQVAVFEAAEAANQPEQGRSKFRLPPKPEDATDLSPCSSPEEDSNLPQPSSVALRRLEAISGRRQQGEKSKSTQDVGSALKGNPALKRLTSGATNPVVSNDNAGQTRPLPASILPLPQPDLALPQTPTTRRRQMLATELPEDLRLNLIWERKSRAPMYPIRKNSNLRPTASAQDLPETARQAQQSMNPGMSRQNTEPVADHNRHDPLPKRRTSHNLLGGSGQLRPLTSAAATSRSSQQLAQELADEPDLTGRPQGNLVNNRSKSIADMSHWHRSRLTGQETAQSAHQMTEGEQEVHNDWVRARHLRQREGELSSSFRSHGW